MLRTILPTLALGLTATAADAALVTYAFSGTLTRDYSSTTANYAPPQVFNGFFTLDDTDLDATSSNDTYAFSDFHVQVGSYAFSGGSSGNATLFSYSGARELQLYAYEFADVDPSAGLERVDFGLYLRSLGGTGAQLPTQANVDAAGELTASFRIFGADSRTLTSIAGSTAFSPNVFGPVMVTTTAGVPEPATWAMMIAGFGLVGGAMRRRQVPAIA